MIYLQNMEKPRSKIYVYNVRSMVIVCVLVYIHFLVKAVSHKCQRVCVCTCLFVSMYSSNNTSCTVPGQAGAHKYQRVCIFQCICHEIIHVSINTLI
jgi:hypothetical protein